jgi:hypothetical protein
MLSRAEFGNYASNQQDIKETSFPTLRLIIQKIVLENFKSYAGIQEVGPFHQVSTLTLNK